MSSHHQKITIDINIDDFKDLYAEEDIIEDKEHRYRLQDGAVPTYNALSLSNAIRNCIRGSFENEYVWESLEDDYPEEWESWKDIANSITIRIDGEPIIDTRKKCHPSQTTLL